MNTGFTSQAMQNRYTIFCVTLTTNGFVHVPQSRHPEDMPHPHIRRAPTARGAGIVGQQRGL